MTSQYQMSTPRAQALISKCHSAIKETKEGWDRKESAIKKPKWVGQKY